MEQSNQSKKVLLSVIGVAILVVAVVGVSFAFFNYTRAGQQNNVATGKIWFGSTQSGALQVSNYFPGANDGANQTATINVHGGTTYGAGMQYRLKVVDVKRNGVAYDTTAQGNVPIVLNVSAATAGANQTGVNDTDHGTFTPTTPTGGSAGVAIPLTEGAVIGTGTITGNNAATENWMNGDITVRVYIPSNLAITDTLVTDNDAPSGYENGTTTEWLNGRTRITTAAWNALGEYPVTFRILVESTEAGGTYQA